MRQPTLLAVSAASPPQWFHYHLEKQLPGPHFLRTFTVPEPLRPFIRSQQRLAYHALCTAAAEALKRLAKDERFIGTALPGLTGVLHTRGRQRQYHPHIHSIVPGAAHGCLGLLSSPYRAWAR